MDLGIINPQPQHMPLPQPLLPEEIIILGGIGLITAYVLGEILKIIPRNQRRPMFLQLDVVVVLAGNSIQFGVIDLMDLSGANLRLLYSGNPNVAGRFVSMGGFRAYALMCNEFVSMDSYNNNRNSPGFLPDDTYVFHRLNFPSPDRNLWLSLIATSDLAIRTGIHEDAVMIEPTPDNVDSIFVYGMEYLYNNLCVFVD